MPTIGSKVSAKELDAITEYANLCVETISNLIRKVVIAEATMLNGGWTDEHPEYELKIIISDGLSAEEEDQITEEKVNRIRRILGWKDIRLTS